jgi:hypothetical protein
VRSTWDYTDRRDEFVAWADRLGERLVNPPAVLRWNTDKRYLADLDAARLPVTPTTFLEPGAPIVLPDGRCVVKPAVSAGSRDTASHDAGTAGRAAAAAHVRRLHAAGRVALVQPYLDEVDEHGETALLYCDGAYSHAIRKGAMLQAGPAAVEGLFAPEDIRAREPRPVERSVADAVMAFVAARFGAAPLYGRVDLIGADPVVIEVELTEPSLFFAHDEEAPARFAAAIRRRARARASS